MAAILGKAEDEKYYTSLFKNICDGYIRRFVNEDGTIKGDFQSAYVLPLYFGMAGRYRQKFAGRLAQLVKDNNYHLSTGFASTPYILFALADNGYEDVAYRVLMQDTCPSWLYEVKAGATTMWERWDALRPDGSVYNASMTSFNHYAYGCVCGWMWTTMAGIASDTSNPGFKRIVLKPIPDRRLGFVDAEYASAAGLIKSRWRYEGNKWIWQFTIPDGSVADVTIPGETQSKEYRPGSYTIKIPAI